MSQRFQLQLLQRYNDLSGEVILNMFYYQNDGAPGSSADLADRFDSQVVGDIADIASAAIKYQAIQVINLDDPIDYTVAPVTSHTEGQRSGDCLPPMVAWGYRYNRATRAVRNGQKRFAGVAEPDQVNGVSSSGIATPLSDLAITLESPVTGSGTTSYVPMIGRRPPPGHGIVDTVLFPITSVQYVRITTQNTRKFGRGA